MRDVRWGIFTTSSIAGLMADTIRFVNGEPVAAVASRDIERARKFASDHGIAKSYGSYADLANDPDIDIIYIASPMSHHYEQSMLALTHGKNVFCEKAVTVNATQMQTLADESSKRGLLFCEAMWTKCLPSYLQAKQWINDGVIGDVELVKADFCINMPIFNAQSRMVNSALGGGALLDLGSYGFHFITGLMGNTPDCIRSTAHIGSTGVDFDSVTELTYGSAKVFLTLGFDMEGKSVANIIGSKGSIFFDANFPHTPHIKLKNEFNHVKEDLTVKFDYNGYEYEVTEVQNALRKGRISTEKIPVEDSIAVMRICDECRRQWGMKYTCE